MFLPQFVYSLCKEYMKTPSEEIKSFKPVEIVGKQKTDDVWVFNPHVHVDKNGRLIPQDERAYVSMEASSLPYLRNISSDLDDGAAFKRLLVTEKALFQNNYPQVVLAHAGSSMACNYDLILKKFDGCAIPVLMGPSVSGKTTALKAVMSIFGIRKFTCELGKRNDKSGTKVQTILDNDSVLTNVETILDNDSVLPNTQTILDNDSVLTNVETILDNDSVLPNAQTILDNDSVLTNVETILDNDSVLTNTQTILDNDSVLTNVETILDNDSVLTNTQTILDNDSVLTNVETIFDNDSVLTNAETILDNDSVLPNTQTILDNDSVLTNVETILDNDSVLTNVETILDNDSVLTNTQTILDNDSVLTNVQTIFDKGALANTQKTVENDVQNLKSKDSKGGKRKRRMADGLFDKLHSGLKDKRTRNGK
ncbi:uncharacterized protein LOC114541331 [Dendronephthya gigantea]|uniref:uncharacterized protein LOC114541331 n=1 Tax=Dendronephthya gigantea TaxID=151771 RepID=UPI00106A8DE9|nr:uncharacterized protein LOC114541331 [Dendronephthya gigantea]